MAQTAIDFKFYNNVKVGNSTFGIFVTGLDNKISQTHSYNSELTINRFFTKDEIPIENSFDVYVIVGKNKKDSKTYLINFNKNLNIVIPKRTYFSIVGKLKKEPKDTVDIIFLDYDFSDYDDKGEMQVESNNKESKISEKMPPFEIIDAKNFDKFFQDIITSVFKDFYND